MDKKLCSFHLISLKLQDVQNASACLRKGVDCCIGLKFCASSWISHSLVSSRWPFWDDVIAVEACVYLPLPNILTEMSKDHAWIEMDLVCEWLRWHLVLIRVCYFCALHNLMYLCCERPLLKAVHCKVWEILCSQKYEIELLVLWLKCTLLTVFTWWINELKSTKFSTLFLLLRCKWCVLCFVMQAFGSAKPYGSSRSIVRRIATSLPLKPCPRVHFQVREGNMDYSFYCVAL